MRSTSIRFGLQSLLCSASGLLLAICILGPELEWLGWVALVPLGASVVVSTAVLETVLSALAGGVVFGLVSLDWFRTVHANGGVFGPWTAAWIATALLLSPAWCVVVLLVQHLRAHMAAPYFVALPLGWTAGDFARRVTAVFFTEMDFPWLQLATTQAESPVIVQAADIVGATGVGAVIALVNGSVCDVLLERHRAAKAKALIAALCAVSILLAYGHWRLSHSTQLTGPRIALMPWDKSPGTFTDCTQMRDIADIMLWPEGIVQDFSQSPESQLGEFQRFATATNAIAVVCWYRVSSDQYANTITVANPMQNAVQTYDKRYLVPHVEFTPRIGFGAVHELYAQKNNSHSSPPFLWRGVRVAPGICYDACFLGFYRAMSPVDLYLISSAETVDSTQRMSDQLMRIVRLRAIEFRRPIVRNVEGGHSGVIDSCGRVLVDIPDLQEPTVVGPIPLDDRRSLYSVTGDWILLVPFAVLGVVQIVRARRRRVRTQPDQSNN